jgi:hypothetical protein
VRHVLHRMLGQVEVRREGKAQSNAADHRGQAFRFCRVRSNIERGRLRAVSLAPWQRGEERVTGCVDAAGLPLLQPCRHGKWAISSLCAGHRGSPTWDPSSMGGEQGLVHTLQQLDQRLVDGVDSNQPQTGVLQVDDDIHRYRHDRRKPKHMSPTARSGACHAVSGQ